MMGRLASTLRALRVFFRLASAVSREAESGEARPARSPARRSWSDARRDVQREELSPEESYDILAQHPSLASLVVQNPSAPPAVLEHLARVVLLGMRVSLPASVVWSGPTPEVIRRLPRWALAGCAEHLARNPNTPLHALFAMSLWNAGLVIENPSLSLHVIERPGFWIDAPAELITAFVRREVPPPGLLRDFAEHRNPSVRAAAAGVPELPQEYLLRLLFETAPIVRQAAQQNPSLDARLKEVYARLAAFEATLSPQASDEAARREAANRLSEQATLEELCSLGPFARICAAQHPDLSEALQRRLAADPDLGVQRALAGRSRLDEAALLRLIRHGYESVSLALLQSQSLSEAHLATLLGSGHSKVRMQAATLCRDAAALARHLRDRDPRVRAVLAQNPALSTSAQQTLAADTDPAVRAALAGRPDALPLVLSQLALGAVSPPSTLEGQRINAEPDLLLLVARHPNADPALLLLMAQDASPACRVALAQNPSAPPLLLSRLLTPRSPEVYRALAQNPATEAPALAWLLADSETEVRALVLTNPRVSPELLERAGRSASAELRYGAAKHPATPPGLLAWLAVDLQALVRAGVALNPAASDDLLRQLLRDRDPWVRAMLAKHARLTPEALRRLARDKHPAVRQRAALHPALSFDVLQRLALDPRWPVRAAAARSRHASPALLTQLAEDSSPTARLSVTAHPATPRGILNGLQHDKTPFVSRAAARALEGRSPSTPHETPRRAT